MKHELERLATLILAERGELLAKWRGQVRALPSAKHLDAPTLNDHLPRLLTELAVALRERTDESIPEALAHGSSPEHGSQRVLDGFDIEEVVAEYNILRGCIHDLADAHGIALQGRGFHVLNRVLDGAIGLAVRSYAEEKALEVQQRREEYLAFVAHDLRTPLNAISLAARVLELTISAAPTKASIEQMQMMKSLHRNVAQLDTLVTKVIKENTSLVAEVGIRVERRTFDLWPLVEALSHDLHPVAGTNSTKLSNEVPEDLVIHADAGLLRRVFQNLIANAIRYTPRGSVVIGARADADDLIVCWVRDSGAGIPADRIGAIFDPLESDAKDEAGAGSGLGLAIVKTFVEAHGGHVTVESTVGVGSKFQFTIPHGRR